MCVCVCSKAVWRKVVRKRHTYIIWFLCYIHMQTYSPQPYRSPRHIIVTKQRQFCVSGKLRIQARPRGKIRPRWHVKDTLNTVIFMRKQYHLIIMREQNPPPPMTNMLNGQTTRHTLYNLYSQYVVSSNYINMIFKRKENPPTPMTNLLNGLTTSTLSSWGIKIRHLLRTICWLGK